MQEDTSDDDEAEQLIKEVINNQIKKRKMKEKEKEKYSMIDVNL